MSEPGGINRLSTLKALQTEAGRIAKSSGWWDRPRDVPELIALCHSELSEALEEYRAGYPVSLVYYWFNNEQIELPPPMGSDVKPEGFGVELADVMIRILDMAERFGIDLEDCINRKMAYNEKRPYRHGGKIA